MAKRINRLTVKAIENFKAPGYYHDGGGLYLQVLASGGKTWLYRYALNGKPRWMGLGGFRDVGLEAARTARDEARALQKGRDKVDPVTHRQAQRVKAERASKTFDQVASGYIDAHRAEWRASGIRGDKYAREWAATLKTYASPVFGSLPVHLIDAPLVIQVIEPIWRIKAETATRVRGRIESILDYATVHGWRDGENPARWRGHLALVLPKKAKVAPVEHRAAMPYAAVPAFMKALRARQTTAARALELIILTAARAGEAVGATWAEIAIEARTWTVPASRMKGSKVHRVPLSNAALTLLKNMQATHADGHVFPGLREGKALTLAAPLKTLHDMGYDSLTVHGFRSSFRDWASEQTAYPREVCEAALAHTLGNATEAAYQRSDLFDKRARLMADWAAYCACVKSDGVVPIRSTQKAAI